MKEPNDYIDIDNIDFLYSYVTYQYSHYLNYCKNLCLRHICIFPAVWRAWWISSRCRCVWGGTWGVRYRPTTHENARWLLNMRRLKILDRLVHGTKIDIKLFIIISSYSNITIKRNKQSIYLYFAIIIWKIKEKIEIPLFQ